MLAKRHRDCAADSSYLFFFNPMVAGSHLRPSTGYRTFPPRPQGTTVLLAGSENRQCSCTPPR